MAASNRRAATMTVSPSLLIDPLRLQTLLGEARGRFDVDALAECTSTNSVLLSRAGRVRRPAASS